MKKEIAVRLLLMVAAIASGTMLGGALKAHAAVTTTVAANPAAGCAAGQACTGTVITATTQLVIPQGSNASGSYSVQLASLSRGFYYGPNQPAWIFVDGTADVASIGANGAGIAVPSGGAFAFGSMSGASGGMNAAFNATNFDVRLTRPAAKQLLVSGDGTGTATTMQGWRMGQTPTADWVGLWYSGTASPILTNGVLYSNGSIVVLNSPDGSAVRLASSNVTKLSVDGTAGTGATITAGTATTDVNAISATQTWNNAGVTFTGYKFSVTDQAADAGSAAASLHTAWLAGTAGTTQIMTLGKTGTLSVAGLKTTGAATGKNVVCVDTATGQLYASSTGTDCSN